MTKNLSFLMLLFFLLPGCSSKDWTAKYFMVRAEKAMDEAANLRTKQVPFEKRVSLYQQACKNFSRAFDFDPNVFTLSRIESASDSCWKGNLEESEAMFKQFEEAYIKDHPQEYEYGDSGVGMMDMGG